MKNNHLPQYAFVKSEITGDTVMIINGESGYHWDKNLTGFSPEEMNDYWNVTPEQLNAMIIGALFSWKAPGAQLSYHINKEVG